MADQSAFRRVGATRCGLAIAFFCNLAAAQTPADAPEAFVFKRAATVERATITGGKFFLGLESGDTALLAGVVAPSAAALSDDGAERALARLTLGQPVQLWMETASPDRWGRWVAQAEISDVWIQGALLARGVALAAPGRGESAMAAEAIAAEDRARAARHGLWLRRPRLRVAPWSAAYHMHRFVHLEGPADWARSRRNGGAEIRFKTRSPIAARILLSPEAAAVLAARWGPVESWPARRIRVRGWLTDRAGPMIEAGDAAQIEDAES